MCEACRSDHFGGDQRADIGCSGCNTSPGLAGTRWPFFLGFGAHNALTAYLASLSLDFAVRKRLGGSNLNMFMMNELPVLGPRDRHRWEAPIRPQLPFLA